MEYSKIYAQRIRELCRAREISIYRLAALSGVRQQTLDNIMHGVSKNPTAKTLHKVANSLSMTLAEFLDFEALNQYSFEEDDTTNIKD